MYTQIKNSDGEISDCLVMRDADSFAIPFKDDNIDYQEYLAWLSAGNTPTPAN